MVQRRLTSWQQKGKIGMTVLRGETYSIKTYVSDHMVRTEVSAHIDHFHLNYSFLSISIHMLVSTNEVDSAQLILQTTRSNIFTTPVINIGIIRITMAHLTSFWVGTLCFRWIYGPGANLLVHFRFCISIISLLPPWILWPGYVCIESGIRLFYGYRLIYLRTLGTQMWVANQTTEQISVLPRRIVTIATVYTPYLYNEVGWTDRRDETYIRVTKTNTCTLSWLPSER